LNKYPFDFYCPADIQHKTGLPGTLAKSKKRLEENIDPGNA